MAKGWKIAFSIIGCVILIYVFVFIRGMRMMKWQIHEPMSPEQQESYSIKARIPSVAGIWERYAVRGIRDPEYMLESNLYKNIDEMTNALPEFAPDVEQALGDSCIEASDIKGDPVKKYSVKGIKQASEDELGAAKYPYGCNTEFFVIEYADGSLRFVADISVT